MGCRNTTKHILAVGIVLFIASVVLALISSFTVASASTEYHELLDCDFQLSPLETRRYGLGSFPSGDNVTVQLWNLGVSNVTYSIVVYEGAVHSGNFRWQDRFSFTSDNNYYEIVFTNEQQLRKNVHMKASTIAKVDYQPNSWLTLPAKLLFVASWALIAIVLLKTAVGLNSLSIVHSDKPFLIKQLDRRLFCVLFVSLLFWFGLLLINRYPYGTFENWYTDHARHPYSAYLFTKVGFSVFDTPLGTLAGYDHSYYKFVTWPEMPHLYPIGSIFLFLPFGFLLEQGFPMVSVFKMEVALFLIFSHLSLYYFLRIILAKRMAYPVKFLGIYFFYLSTVVYSANGMFDAVALLFALISTAEYMEDRYDHCFFYALLSASFKYQAGLFLLPLASVALLKFLKKADLRAITRNKLVLLSAFLLFIDAATVYLSAPFLMNTKPEHMMNFINIFGSYPLVSWELRFLAVLLTLATTVLAAFYLLHNKSSLSALFSIFTLLTSYTLPYFQPWYLSYFFVYALTSKRKGAREITLIWLFVMMCVLSYGGRQYSPLWIYSSIESILNYRL